MSSFSERGASAPPLLSYFFLKRLNRTLTIKLLQVISCRKPSGKGLLHSVDADRIFVPPGKRTGRSPAKVGGLASGRQGHLGQSHRVFPRRIAPSACVG